MEENYYDILEVSKNASPEIIEKAYKTLVKKYHPDLQKNEKCKPPGASYHQKGHLPDQGRNHATRNKGKRRAAAFDGRQQQEAGDPPGSG